MLLIKIKPKSLVLLYYMVDLQKMCDINNIKKEPSNYIKEFKTELSSICDEVFLKKRNKKSYCGVLYARSREPKFRNNIYVYCKK